MSLKQILLCRTKPQMLFFSFSFDTAEDNKNLTITSGLSMIKIHEVIKCPKRWNALLYETKVSKKWTSND